MIGTSIIPISANIFLLLNDSDIPTAAYFSSTTRNTYKNQCIRKYGGKICWIKPAISLRAISYVRENINLMFMKNQIIIGRCDLILGNMPNDSAEPAKTHFHVLVRRGIYWRLDNYIKGKSWTIYPCRFLVCRAISCVESGRLSVSGD